MEKEFRLVFTGNEVDLIYQALMELPAKVSMPTIEKLRLQVKEALTPEEDVINEKEE